MNRPVTKTAPILGTLVLAAVLFLAGSANAMVDGPRWPAPSFPTPKVWINSKPLTLKQLRGKVVLIVFWDYTSINCIRSMPHWERWSRLYGPDGFVLIGFHTPEFGFAKNVSLVKDAVRRFGLTFPVAIDNDGKVWDAFHNPGWPTEYLVDKQGRVVDREMGEGHYELAEREIQYLLREGDPALDFKAAKYKIPDDEPGFGGVCLNPTPETHLGTIRSMLISNPGGLKGNKPVKYLPPKVVPVDTAALEGIWRAGPDGIHTASTQDSAIELNYNSKSVYLVAGSDNGSSQRAYIRQDGKWIPSDARGVDVQTDWLGRTYVELGEKRLYYLVSNPKFGAHLLRITIGEPGIGLYSFSYGNNCETKFPHK